LYNVDLPHRPEKYWLCIFESRGRWESKAYPAYFLGYSAAVGGDGNCRMFMYCWIRVTQSRISYP